MVPPQPLSTLGAPRTTLTSMPRAGHVRGKAASEANPSKEDTLGLVKVVLIHVDR